MRRSYLQPVLLLGLIVSSILFNACGTEDEEPASPITTNDDQDNDDLDIILDPDPTPGPDPTPPPTETTVSTIFIASQGRQLSVDGFFVEEFSIDEQTTFLFNLSSMYSVQAGIITPAQLSNFQNFNAFEGFALFDNNFGYQIVTLDPGTYYVGVRNLAAVANMVSVELDIDIQLPETDQHSFFDFYITGIESLEPGALLWHGFSIDDNARYFIDGCHTGGLDVYTIPTSELNNFQSLNSFQFYTDYSGEQFGADPGLWEYKLPNGEYYLAIYNSSSEPQSIVYHLERWIAN